MNGTEKQIKYAQDIINEVYRILPLAIARIEKSERELIERKGKGNKINQLNLKQLQNIKEYIKNEERADLIITAFKNVLLENEHNKISALISCASAIYTE